jgi:drug/metabolite transporter (DMT)-like permease
MHPQTKPLRWLASPYLLLTLASLFWAGNWVVGRAMRNDIPPVAMGFWRWAIALLILLPIAGPELKRNWHIVRANWFTLALLGSSGATLFNTMIYIGLQYTAATNGVLFNSITPILIIVMSWLAFRERLAAWQTTGVVLSLAGVAVIVARGEPQVLAELKFNRGDLWLISAMFLWAVYTIVLRRRPPALSAIGFLAAMLLLGLPLLLPFYLWELVHRGLSVLESWRCANRSEQGGTVRASDAGIRRAAVGDLSRRAAVRLPLRGGGPDIRGNLSHDQKVVRQCRGSEFDRKTDRMNAGVQPDVGAGAVAVVAREVGVTFRFGAKSHGL